MYWSSRYGLPTFVYDVISDTRLLAPRKRGVKYVPVLDTALEVLSHTINFVTIIYKLNKNGESNIFK